MPRHSNANLSIRALLPPFMVTLLRNQERTPSHSKDAVGIRRQTNPVSPEERRCMPSGTLASSKDFHAGAAGVTDDGARVMLHERQGEV